MVIGLNAKAWYTFKIRELSMDCRTPVPPIHTVYHAFGFKPITVKFGEFTHFWMLFQMTCPIFNSIDNEVDNEVEFFAEFYNP